MIWLGLFLIILATSFILAYFSMRNYQDALPKGGSGLYLVRHPAVLSQEFILKLHEALQKQHSYISLERLFKGKEEALVLFGPVTIEKKFPQLDLLELEDYTNIAENNVNLWEMTLKEGQDLPAGRQGRSLPPLGENEQFWLQMILRPQGGEDFQISCRAAVVSGDQRRKNMLTATLKERIGPFVFVPRPFSSSKMLTLYKERALPSFYSSSSKVGPSSLLKLMAKF